MSFTYFVNIFIVFSLCAWKTGQCIDLTTQANATGAAVVSRCIELIENSGIFRDDSNLLRRLAYVETTDGVSYVANQGGIWKISQFVFTELQTQNFNASNYYAAVTTHFSIDWQSVTYADLDKPIYSALAARLVIAHAEIIVSGTISTDVNVQYNTWAFYFHDNQQSTTLSEFTTSIAQIPTQCQSDQRDIVLLIESSSAIPPADFNNMKAFALSLIGGFSISVNKTRFGIMQFANNQMEIVSIRDGVDLVNVTNAINGMTLLNSEPVRTGIAVAHAVSLFTSSGRSINDGFATVLVVITERPSIDNVSVPVSNAVASGIDIISVGVGNNIATSEITSIASASNNVFYSSSFTSLLTLTERVTTGICQAQIVTTGNLSISGTLFPSTSQSIRLTLSAFGTGFRLSTTIGTITAYFSTTINYPTSAVYDNRMVVNIPNTIFFYNYTPPAAQIINGQIVMYVGLECTSTVPTVYQLDIGTPYVATIPPVEVVSVSEAPLSDAEIAGIVIACLIFLCGIIIAVVYYCCARNYPIAAEKKEGVEKVAVALEGRAVNASMFSSQLMTVDSETPEQIKKPPTHEVAVNTPLTPVYANESFSPVQAIDDEETVIRERLRTAVVNKNIPMIVAGLVDFQNLELSDKDGDVILAEKIISVQNCKEGLSYAMAKRNVHYLQRAIFDAKQKNHQQELSEEIQNAEILLKDLNKIQSCTAKLKAAMDNDDVDLVEQLTFELRKLCGSDHSAVDKLLEVYRCKDDLERSMRTRDLELVTTTLDIIEKRGYESELSVEVKQAKRMKRELEYLEKVRRDVLNLNQSRVSEIRSYGKPPPGVHGVMKAVYLILGHPRELLEKWGNIQILMGKTGKDGLRRQIQAIDPRKVNLEKAQTAFSIIEQFDLAAVQELSLGLSLFYIFVRSVIEEVEKLHTGVLNAPSPFDYLRATATPRPNWDKLQAAGYNIQR
ncbi:uncharacterized protein LOC104266065 [Ciona intestinalis]